VERYSDPQSFAREVNLPLIGTVHVTPIPAAAPAAAFLAADDPEEMRPVVDLLTQTRKSLTLRSLFLTGFPHDPEFFAAGVALARQWTRQGLRVGVVDLDYRHPTVVRPRPHPNEGFVDALEYGCSFQRIAWEVVADALWLVGPGSHPPEERRFSEHPDWTRVMRIFSARVDVTLYMAPFLDRKGFTGALSKRMDGVVLAACVRRSGRAALRDAFLELWGSDAPMIGCIGIDSPDAPGPAVRASGATAAPLPEPPVASSPADWGFPSPDVHRPADAPERRSAPRGSGSRVAPGRDSVEAVQEALVARLSDEVRRGHVPRSSRSRGILLALIALALAGAGVFVTYQAMHREGGRASAPQETLPAGTEQVLPADLGTSGAGTPPLDGSGVTAAPAPGAVPSAPEAQATEDAQPSPPAKLDAPTLASLRYEVHVASFSQDAQARLLVKRLCDKGLDAWYAKATNQRNWYRVFVGHYATHEEASRQAASLLGRGLVEHAIAYPDHAR
jgi:cell division septation protein DedD